MSYFLGIDLGTTRTSAAVGHPGVRPGEVVDLGDRSSAVPSVLYAGADGSVLVGEAAERRALTDPSRVVREFKRRIGDPTPLVVAGVAWSPQELSARVVRWAVDRVGEREGGPAARIAVTHPATWGPLKRELLGGALVAQGLSVSFLPEPQAAALHYASTERLEPGSTIAVYDLGGGTFDAAVVHKSAPHHEVTGFELVGRPEGLERLGGVDFDQVVFDHVRAAMPEVFADLDETDPAVLAAVAAVRRECSEAKEALSADTEVSIPVLLPGAQGSVRLHRSEFEAMIRPQIEETVSALRRAVVSAALTSDQLTAVLLVGGSSRIPLVAQLVSEQLGRPVAVDADPKNAIALGAALSLDPAALYASPGGSGAHIPVPRASGPVPYPVGAGQRGPSGTGNRQAGAVAAAVPGAAMAEGMGSFAPPGPPQQRLGPPNGTGTRFAVPPPRPAPYPERPPMDEPPSAYDAAYDYEDYDRPEPPLHRSPAVLVAVGGVAAAVAVLATVFLMPTGQPTVAPSVPSATVPVLPPVEPAPPQTPAPGDDVDQPADDAADDPAPVRPTRPVAPVVPQPTQNPGPSEEPPPPPSSSEEPPPPSSSEEPPPSSSEEPPPPSSEEPPPPPP